MQDHVALCGAKKRTYIYIYIYATPQKKHVLLKKCWFVFLGSTIHTYIHKGVFFAGIYWFLKGLEI